MYRIGNWINKESGWIIEIVEAEYVNISVYSPLSGSIYIKLPHRLKNSMKGLIILKATTINVADNKYKRQRQNLMSFQTIGCTI